MSNHSPISFTLEQKKYRIPIFLTILSEVLLFGLYLKVQNILFVLLFVSGLISFYWISFSLRNIFIFALALISLLPSESWGMRYPFFHGLYFKIYYLYIIAFLAILWLVFNKPFKTRLYSSPSSLDTAFFIFLLLSCLAVVRGGFEERVFPYLEFTMLMLYSFYFIFKYYLPAHQLNQLWNVFMVITVAVSIEYIMLAFSEAKNASLFLVRVVTQQPHLAQFAFPFFMSYFFITGMKITKLIAGIGLFFVLGMIFFSQQRGLWVGIVFSLFILSVSYFFIGRKVTILQILKFFLIILSFIVILILTLLLFDKIFFGSVFLTLITRVESILNFSMDLSMQVRMSEISRAMIQWKSDVFSLLFGKGLGATISSIDPTRQNTISVDNSFVLFLWKMGVFGLLSFLSIFILFTKRVFVIAKKSTVRQKQITLSIFSGFSGLLVVGLTNACLYRYQFIVIWAFFIAIVEVFYVQTRDDEFSECTVERK